MKFLRIIYLKCCFLLITVNFCNFIYCQNSSVSDSLIKIVKSNNADTIKIDALSYLFNIYEFSDTVKAEYYLKQELNLANKLNNSKWLAGAYQQLAFLFEDKSDLNKAIKYHQEALDLYKTNHLLSVKTKSKNISACYNNIALIYGKLGVYEKALDYYFLSLKIDNLLGDSIGVSISYMNIGIINRKLGNNDKALVYYFKSLKIAEQLNDISKMASCYNNIGLAYQYKKDYSKAIYYITKSIKINEKLNDNHRLSGCYNNLGNVYFELGQNEKCLKYYKKSLSIRTQIGDKEGQSSVLGNIAALNNKLKQYEESINNAKTSANIAKEIGALPLQSYAYQVLAETYSNIENYKSAFEYQKQFKLLNDSIFSIEGSRQIKSMEAKFESEKKQKEIELLNKDKQIQKGELKQQTILKYAFIIGFVFMILLASFIYRNYRNKRKANLLLKQQNAEISQQKEEISTQRDEITAQRDLVTSQKEHIEEIHKSVTDSINYARRIQEAVLPISDTARSVLGEHFILFKPKDIVSGDFYWTTKINDFLIVAVADCTGHGVPGAFMSMLGISFLNEIVRKQEVNQANHVLNELRNEIINALQQKGLQGEQKDGMDISLLVVKTNTNECQWAGANNPIYIIKQFENETMNQFENETTKEKTGIKQFTNFQISKFSNLVELKGDNMPIAIYPQMHDFTNHEFVLQKDDLVYLFTDGYADQFGGLHGRKFMYKQFKDTLFANSKKTILEQKEILEITFENWKGNREQIDDVTILGLKI